MILSECLRVASILRPLPITLLSYSTFTQLTIALSICGVAWNPQATQRIGGHGERWRSKESPQLLLQGSTAVHGDSGDGVHQRRPQHTLQTRHAPRHEPSRLCRLRLRRRSSGSPPVAVLITPITSSTAVEFLHTAQDHSSRNHRVYFADHGIHWNQLQFSDACFGDEQLGSGLYFCSRHHFQDWDIFCRMEKVELSSTSSKAKIIGSVVSISGAIVVTLYKGPILFISTPYTRVSLHHLMLNSLQSNWTIGSLFLAVEYSLVPLWYIVMTQILKEYPAELTLIFSYTLCVSILGAIVGFFVEPDSSKWKITPSVALASFLCSGVFGCCLNNAVHAWALHVRGPVYVAMFKPLSIAIAAAMGVIILGDTLYLGSVIGATVIAFGFYMVMWGKAKEEVIGFDETSDLESSSSTLKHPLLQSRKDEETH